MGYYAYSLARMRLCKSRTNSLIGRKVGRESIVLLFEYVGVFLKLLYIYFAFGFCFRGVVVLFVGELGAFERFWHLFVTKLI